MGRDLLERVVVHIGEHHRLALHRRQRGQRPAHLLGAEPLVFPARSVVADRLGVRPGDVVQGEPSPPDAAPRAAPVQGQEDAVEPGGEGGVVAQLRHPCERADGSLLEQVVALGVRAAQAPRAEPGPPVDGLEQPAQSLSIVDVSHLDVVRSGRSTPTRTPRAGSEVAAIFPAARSSAPVANRAGRPRFRRAEPEEAGHGGHVRIGTAQRDQGALQLEHVLGVGAARAVGAPHRVGDGRDRLVAGEVGIVRCRDPGCGRDPGSVIETDADLDDVVALLLAHMERLEHGRQIGVVDVVGNSAAAGAFDRDEGRHAAGHLRVPR